jgi:hypothetical protein
VHQRAAKGVAALGEGGHELVEPGEYARLIAVTGPVQQRAQLELGQR